MENIVTCDASTASVTRGGGAGEELAARGTYTIVCVGADGAEKWRDEYTNLVTTVGKNDLLDKYLAGSSYTAAWYLGLVDASPSPSYNAADTAASHAGWAESTAYSNSTRPAPTWNAASSGSKASNATVFNINGTATIAGTFLISNDTKGGTTGILFSAGSFTGGNRSVASGDTLNVTYTLSV